MPSVTVSVQGPYVIGLDDDPDATIDFRFEVNHGTAVPPTRLFSAYESGRVVLTGPLTRSSAVVLSNTSTSGDMVSFKVASGASLTEVARITRDGVGEFSAVSVLEEPGATTMADGEIRHSTTDLYISAPVGVGVYAVHILPVS
jgi:hypothetical protein